MSAHLDAELALAAAIGWTNLVDVGGMLLGTPPGGAPESRGQAAVPRWTRSWEACGTLMVDTRLIYVINDGIAYAGEPDGRVLAATPIADHGGENAAVRYALVLAATVKLHAFAAFERARLTSTGAV